MKCNQSFSFQKTSLEERKASEKRHVAKRGWYQSYEVIHCQPNYTRCHNSVHCLKICQIYKSDLSHVGVMF